MNCTHSAIIQTKDGAIKCLLCGEILHGESVTDKNPPEQAKAAETPENAVKTEAKKTTRKKTK